MSIVNTELSREKKVYIYIYIYVNNGVQSVIRDIVSWI